MPIESDAKDSETARLTFLGHSTVLVELDGTRLITDPVLRSRIALLRRQGHASPPPDPPSVDGVLISHLHWDHLDLPSLARLGRTVPILVPVGAGAHLRRRGFANARELAPGDETTINGTRVLATPANHHGLPRPLNPTRRCLGFVVAGSRSVYFAGDTDLFPEMAALHPDLDAALLPVWGWGPVLGARHLDPRRAAEALRLLRPKLAVPIHWGTLYPMGLGRVRRRVLSEPPLAFARHAAVLAPEVEVRVVPPGGSTSLDPSAPGAGVP